MKTNKLPFIRWYASDFLAGTRGMKAFEIGIYTVLINQMYERCEPLPIDIDRLSRQCGCTKPVFIKTLKMLKEYDKIIMKDAGLWNNRVEVEFIYRQNKILVAKQNINARWKKDNKINGKSIQTNVNGNTDSILSQKPETRKKEDTKVSPKEIVELWNKTCPHLGKVIKLTDKRKSHIAARIKNDIKSVDEWENYFKTINESSFLGGDNNSNWKATFDWVLNQNNIAKVLEGNYSQTSGNKKIATGFQL